MDRTANVDYNFMVTDHDQPSEEDCATLLNVLRKFTKQQVGTLDNHDFAVLIVDPERQILVGITAQSRWGGFQIDVIALDESLRRKGIGSRLMQLAEQAAVRRECHPCCLILMNFKRKNSIYDTAVLFSVNSKDRRLSILDISCKKR